MAYLFVTAASGHRTIIYERNSLPAITIDEQLKTLTKERDQLLAARRTQEEVAAGDPTILD